MNMPSLHIHLDRSDKQSWVDWTTTRNEGTSYFASAMRYVGASRTHPCYNALRQFAPEGAADDGSSLYDEELMTQAASQWGAWMKQFLPADHFSSQNQRCCVSHWLSQQSEEYDYTPTMEGRLIYVPATWAARLRWLDGSERTLQLRFPNSTKAIYNQQPRCNAYRQVNFVEPCWQTWEYRRMFQETYHRPVEDDLTDFFDDEIFQEYEHSCPRSWNHI
ncbi:uncharacterized protein BYT42DRAFT_172730 [Radiomyces spectabilis]|uniref:uncharacterized protein n=1 Tax=Radiomyces spectabilis TaxID=64574 RepID=UPI0022207C7D|nr:uncharacterized protein BYT42DRAFT_172730 [Radiomyces spectabilis]KAI8390860.1 hypothetical protein BYT42DRAFT_172730 [Radiomyces spectabilis]